MRNEKEYQLVGQILKGDEKALRIFYDNHAKRLTHFIQIRVANEHDVEELVQDTLTATLEAFRDFSFRCSIHTFICSIAKRKVIDYYRKQKIKRLLFSESPKLEALLAVLTTPEDELDATLVKIQIENAFAMLSPRYRILLKKKYIENQSIVRIADDLAMSFKSVESMLFRARKAFVKIYHDTNSMDYSYK